MEQLILEKTQQEKAHSLQLAAEAEKQKEYYEYFKLATEAHKQKDATIESVLAEK